MGQGCSSKRGPVVLPKGPNHTQSSKGRDDAARNAFHLVLDKTDPFTDLPEGLVDELYYKSELVEYKGRQSVYERRGISDAFFIVIKGSVYGDDGAAASNVGVLFGHTEIVQENPRTRTMTAGRGGATLRRVFADDYRAAVEKRRALLQTNAYRVLQETPVFSGMTSRELMHLRDLVYVKSFAPREVIIQRGSTSADEMYIIESGAAIVSDYVDESDQQSLISKATGGLIPFTILPKEIRLQSRGYFGEEALLLGEEDLDVGEKPSRKATITAAPDSGCVCLVLNRDVFDRVLRKIKHRFYRNIIARDAEFLALVEKGQKQVHEVEAETWERHRSGKYSAPVASVNYEQGHDDNDDEENVAKMRRAAEQFTRRLSVRRPAPSTPAQGKAQAQAHAQSQKRRKVANHGAKDAEGQVEHEESNWLNGVFCGVGV